MLANQDRLCAPELEHAIRRQIEHRTRTRVHKFEVELKNHCVVIRGRVLNYYIKQLVLQGVLRRAWSPKDNTYRPSH
jgi:hypothetical protein